MTLLTDGVITFMNECVNIDTIKRIVDLGEYTFGNSDEKYGPNLLDCCGMSFTAVAKISSGAIDHLLQRPTLAAYRYVRLQRRHKEKARRKKLKEGKHED